MTEKPVTLREVAKSLGLSTFTVSAALKNNPRVAEKTRERVHQEVRRLGYNPNPILSSALSAVRRANIHAFEGTLAAIDLSEDGSSEPLLFHREVLIGARQRAEELGFKMEVFWIGEGDHTLSLKRLGGVLKARGIQGVLILPLNTAQDFSGFDFSGLSAVQMDHCLIKPHLDTILPDHYISMVNALNYLRKIGYERVGLCIEDRRDRRIKNKWSAAFNTYVRQYSKQNEIEPLIGKVFTKKKVLHWFKKNQPDVIISDQQVMVDWLRQSGYQVPDEVGFLRLNHSERSAPCAGLDLNPQRLGATAVEELVGQLHRYEKGVPDYVKTTTIEASWIDGPTLNNPRIQKKRAKNKKKKKRT